MSDLCGLADRQVLVTGGTRGLGREISRQFARAGAHVVANFLRDTAAAQSLEQEAQAEGWSLRTVRADLTGTRGMDVLLESVAAHAPLGGLVHCAATGVHRPIDQLTMRHFDWTFALNVRSLFELIRRLLPHFDKQASIIGVSSEGALRAIPQYTLVGSTKGAMESMLRHLAVELAPRGIRVNILAPGTLMTDVWKVLPDSEERLQASTRKTALKRLCTLEEVARAAQFLCSEAASGIVGHTLVVDGGAAITG